MIIMTNDGYATPEGVRAMLEMEREGDMEFDREHSTGLVLAHGMWMTPATRDYIDAELRAVA